MNSSYNVCIDPQCRLASVVGSGNPVKRDKLDDPHQSTSGDEFYDHHVGDQRDPIRGDDRCVE